MLTRLMRKTMEFHIQIRELPPDLAAINASIGAIDPTAVADIDATGAILRIAAMIESPELIELLAQAGFPVSPRQLTQLPSICCGGCGG
jgi:hypothetical protein